LDIKLSEAPVERSFKQEVQTLRLGAGETFRGEGILAVTKALLQSGVSYVGGYQGAPVSHLLDVMVEAKDLLAELGVHVETCTNEASAAAMLGASINYPLRGAVTWKSIVGTNVAADALSNLASPGVIGGALIVIGEDYGEGASVIQERSYAYALKSSLWLLDPRPDLPTIVRMVEQGFALSEASHAPVMLELRIRACHVTGEFVAKDNVRPAHSGRNPLAPARFDYARLAHPPVTYAQERLKLEQRLPAARAFIREHGLNEVLPGDLEDVGIITLGGLYNGVARALARLGLADLFGNSRVPIYVLNVAYPLVPEELKSFCAGKRAALVVEEGHPEYVEQQIGAELRRADLQTRILGKACLPQVGEYTSEVLLDGLARFLLETRPGGVDVDAIAAEAHALAAHKPAAAAMVGEVPARPPTFCTGCPERPVFSALKLVQREIGPTHISADIGCHSFATFAPFSMGNSILGYGMSLASAAAVGPNLARRPIAVMGDGGFWHNGVITGVASNLFNRGDGVLIVMQNGYTSATGQQFMPSSVAARGRAASGMDIEATLKSMGVRWLRTVHSYSVAAMMRTLKEAMRTAERGLKVIIADGECQLARQRRLRGEEAEKLRRGARVVRVRYGVDDEICTGDHSCIRLSGCPSLTIKSNPDPLRTDPVATVIESCVGCGLCGEVAHAATLCPSFYRAEIVHNPHWRERALHRIRQAVIGWLGAERAAWSPPPLAAEEQGGGNPIDPDARPAPSPTLPRKRGREREAVPSSRTNRETVSRSLSDQRGGMQSERPVSILIAALGGEGGGVLTDWIVGAAHRLGFPVQSTSIPGVAQRTGATTYYIELFPLRAQELAGRRPLLALQPGVGDVDLVVASELLEAGRSIANGFVTPQRTLMLASTHRAYIVSEKMTGSDGRYDEPRLVRAIEENSQARVLFDMDALAKRSGAMINAVMLGAIAGCGRLPIAAEAFEAAIRDDGKAVESNLRGFRAGFEAARNRAVAAAGVQDPPRAALGIPAALEQEIAATMPAAAHEVIAHGVRRLAAYQDVAYARLYLDRLRPIRDADETSGAAGRLLGETARHLALRMSYEDVIRVAEAKTDPQRLARIAGTLGVKPGQPFTVAEVLKPGIAELCSLLPPRLAGRILAIAERRPRLRGAHWAMHVKTTSIGGYLRLRLLAKLKRRRRATFRFRQEQAAIREWLADVIGAARLSPGLGLEVAECARLLKGYGDTLERGAANYRAIEMRVIRPALAGALAPHRAVDAAASARTAALVDPEGEGLARCLAELEQPAFCAAAE
jgi:indolepyruvate ferredoxin oxidoreductase alpha subunit